VDRARHHPNPPLPQALESHEKTFLSSDIAVFG